LKYKDFCVKYGFKYALSFKGKNIKSWVVGMLSFFPPLSLFSLWCGKLGVGVENLVWVWELFGLVEG
jgi:hypothetical protein